MEPPSLKSLGMTYAVGTVGHLENLTNHPSRTAMDSTQIISPSHSPLPRFIPRPEEKLSSSDAVCLHELFEAQVDLRPHSPALIYENEIVSYRELDCLANQLAHYLRLSGIGPGKLVGLYF